MHASIALSTVRGGGLQPYVAVMLIGPLTTVMLCWQRAAVRSWALEVRDSELTTSDFVQGIELQPHVCSDMDRTIDHSSMASMGGDEPTAGAPAARLAIAMKAD